MGVAVYMCVLCQVDVDEIKYEKDCNKVMLNNKLINYLKQTLKFKLTHKIMVM